MLNFYNNIDDKDKLYEFDVKIYKAFFAGSPNIASALKINDHFNIAVESTRSLNARNIMGQGLNPELVYRMNFENFGDSLLENIKDSSVAEKLDKLNLLEFLMADLIAQGYAHNGVEKLNNLFQQLKREEKNAFVLSYLEILEERINLEKEHPTRGVVTRLGSPYNARLVDFISQEDKNDSDMLERSVKFDKEDIPGAKLFFIAKDAIAIFDHSNTPVKFSKINQEKIINQKLSSIPCYKFDQIKIAISDFRNSSIDSNLRGGIFYKVFDYVNEEILTKYYNCDIDDIEFLASKWSEFYPDIDKNTWVDFFNEIVKVKKSVSELNKYRSERINKALEDNNNLSQECYKLFIDTAPDILNLLENDQKIQLQELYDSFKKYYNEKDYDGAHSNMDIFLNHIIDNKELNLDEIRDKNILILFDKYEMLQGKHINNFKMADQDIHNYKMSVGKKILPTIEKESDLVDMFLKNKKNILFGLEKEIINIENESTKNLQEIVFSDYNNFVRQFKYISPEKIGSRDFELILQHFYRPEMRKYIENKIGIKLKDLPFRYQIYLLKFLSEKSEKELDRVIDFLEKDVEDFPENKINKIKAFLSCDSDLKNAEIILRAGELLDEKIADKNFNKMVFERYANMISLVDKIVDSAQEFFEKYHEKDFNERELRIKLLKNSSGELNNLYLILRENKSEEDLKSSIEEILNNFDNISKQKTQTIALLKGEFDKLEKIENLYGTRDDNTKKNTLIENAKERIIDLIFEKEVINLPENFREGIYKEISEYKKEIPDTEREIYLPVGITSKPEEWLEKPIDSLAYLFWLNNQKKGSDLVVVDSIQQSNYEVLYNNGENFPKGFVGRDPLSVAETMGEHDAMFYDKYRKTFNLDLNISKYPREKDESFIDELNYVENLCKENKGVSNAFEKIVETSILKKAKEVNPETPEQELLFKLSKYPKEEVAIILAKNGLKISHEKEFKYDVLAKIISVYKQLNENREAVDVLLRQNKLRGLNLEDAIMNLSVCLSCLEDEEYSNFLQKLFNINSQIEEHIVEIRRLNDSNYGLEQSIKSLKKELNKKSDFGDVKHEMINKKIKTKDDKILSNNNTLSEKSSDLTILQKEQQRVKSNLEKYLNDNPDILNINKTLNKFYNSGLFKYNQERLSSTYSELSQEIKEEPWFDESKIPEFYYPKSITGMSFAMKSEDEEEKIGFREFYSSHTGNRQDWVYSNQIIADPEASLAMFSVLSREAQLEYFESVIKPIIINYYVAIYKDKEIAGNKFLEEFKDINSPIDSLLFIKEKIINETRNAYCIIV
jgi:hypothetical protein